MIGLGEPIEGVPSRDDLSTNGKFIIKREKRVFQRRNPKSIHTEVSVVIPSEFESSEMMDRQRVKLRTPYVTNR